MEGARPPVCSNASRTLTRALSLPASENPCIFTTAQHSLLYSANRSESARVPRLAVEVASHFSFFLVLCCVSCMLPRLFDHELRKVLRIAHRLWQATSRTDLSPTPTQLASY
ncbi:hypothetical protein Tco_0450739 [Tanacetum coccineum]